MIDLLSEESLVLRRLELEVLLTNIDKKPTKEEEKEILKIIAKHERIMQAMKNFI